MTHGSGCWRMFPSMGVSLPCPSERTLSRTPRQLLAPFLFAWFSCPSSPRGLIDAHSGLHSLKDRMNERRTTTEMKPHVVLPGEETCPRQEHILQDSV